MFFKSGIERFIAKRAALFILILTIVDLFFIEKRWVVFLGLISGGVFSILKFCSLSIAISGILNNIDNKYSATKNILGYLFNFILMILLMTLSLVLDKWFGAGMIAGILTVPFIITINNLTEGLGITHNNFEQAKKV